MFRDLLGTLALALEAEGLPYMLIGGQAVLLYGEPRLTRDVDVTLGIGPDRLDEVLALVGRLGWAVRVDDPQEFVRKTFVLPCQDSSTGIRIDFIFSLSAYEQQAIGRARRVSIGNAEVRFASVEDLLIHKIVAGRPRDLEDARGVLAKNPNADAAYIREWLGHFEALTDEPLRQRFDDLRAEEQ